MNGNSGDKVAEVLQIFRDSKVDEWALKMKDQYLDQAFADLENIAVLSRRKHALTELAHFLIQRDH